MFVQQAEGGEDIVDCKAHEVSVWFAEVLEAGDGPLTPVDDPHLGKRSVRFVRYKLGKSEEIGLSRAMVVCRSRSPVSFTICDFNKLTRAGESQVETPDSIGLAKRL